MASLSPENPIMREIGRLREITFRAVGEGTGRATDVDVYDPHYRHLFLWDPKERRLVGAYRLGLAPEIVPKFGVEGLYTHSLFRYSRQLIDRVSSQYDITNPQLETRIMAVVDYISGMTDVYALDVYQKICGISLPIV
jgi:hypothetical protein